MNTFQLDRAYYEAFGEEQGQPYVLPQLEDGQGQFVEVRRRLAAADILGRALFLPVRLGGVDLPNEPTMRITGRKVIQKTRPVGSRRKGSVKELIGIDDESLTIRGIIINTANTTEYPEDGVLAIKELIDRPEALDIESGLTELLGIYRLVIEDWTFPEIRGFQHAQAYEMKCTSDEDWNLEID